MADVWRALRHARSHLKWVFVTWMNGLAEHLRLLGGEEWDSAIIWRPILDESMDKHQRGWI